MLAALRERDIRPDVIVGTSVGALNGAWLAGHPDAPHRRSGARCGRACTAPTCSRPIRAAACSRSRVGGGACSTRSPLRSLIERHVTFDRLEDAPCRCTSSRSRCSRAARCCCRRVRPSTPCSRARRSPRCSIRSRSTASPTWTAASATTRRSRTRCRSTSIRSGCCAPAMPARSPSRRRNPLAMALHALSLLLHKQLVVDVERYESGRRAARAAAAVPADGLAHRLLALRRAHRSRAYQASTRWLDEDHPPVGQAAFLGLHDHAAPDATVQVDGACWVKRTRSSFGVDGRQRPVDAAPLLTAERHRRDAELLRRERRASSRPSSPARAGNDRRRATSTPSSLPRLGRDRRRGDRVERASENRHVSPASRFAGQRDRERTRFRLPLRVRRGESAALHLLRGVGDRQRLPSRRHAVSARKNAAAA